MHFPLCVHSENSLLFLLFSCFRIQTSQHGVRPAPGNSLALVCESHSLHPVLRSLPSSWSRSACSHQFKHKQHHQTCYLRPQEVTKCRAPVKHCLWAARRTEHILLGRLLFHPRHNLSFLIPSLGPRSCKTEAGSLNGRFRYNLPYWQRIKNNHHVPLPHRSRRHQFQ